MSVGVFFIHWMAEDDKKIQDFNHRATKETIARARRGSPTAAEVVAERVRRRVRGRSDFLVRKCAVTAGAPEGFVMLPTGTPVGFSGAARSAPAGTMPLPMTCSTGVTRGRTVQRPGHNARFRHPTACIVGELARLDHLSVSPFGPSQIHCQQFVRPGRGSPCFRPMTPGLGGLIAFSSDQEQRRTGDIDEPDPARCDRHPRVW